MRKSTSSKTAGFLAKAQAAITSSGFPLKKVKTYILFGQSNATGQGIYTDLPLALQGSQSGSWLYEGRGSSLAPRHWVEMVPGHNTAPNPNIALNSPFTTYSASNGNSRHGVEVTLSDTLKANYGEDIYAIKIGHGGVAASNDLAGNDWSTLSNELLDNGDGSLGDDVLIQAVTKMLSMGLCPDWLGAVWIQGERDRSIETRPEVYQEAERLIVNWLRQQVGVAGLPFVSFLLPDFAVDNGDVNAAKNANASTISNYSALAGGTSNVGDSIHYDSAALQDMGIRAAAVL